MALSQSLPGGQVQRRDKFRKYMRAFNPTARAQDVIEAGLVFEDLHRSVYLNLAGRADLEPGSQQLLVGGIGSGKTTELVLATKWLRDQGHVLPLYIDITAETDLSALNSGSLLASFGIHLVLWLLRNSGLPKNSVSFLNALDSKIREYAYGKVEQVWVMDDGEGPEPEYDDEGNEEDLDSFRGYYTTRRIPGKLKPPLPALLRDVESVREPLEQLLVKAREIHKDIVVVFDGLDRLLDPERFSVVANQDFRLLRSLSVSVLAAAPISILYGVGRSVAEQFDRVQHLTVIAGGQERGFLQSVLTKRGGYELLSPKEADAICDYSGGVLRDLVSLARDAAEEAYVSGHELITPADVEKAAHQLGTSYLRGLGPAAIKILTELGKSKSFQVDAPANIELLVTQRILEYTSTDFRAHPALLSVLPNTKE
jgi:hypothetical protein